MILNLAYQMLVTPLSYLLYLIAMLKTTPLVVTVGLSLTIPLAVAGDFLLGRTVKLMSLFGAFLVVSSFIVVGLEDSKNDEVLAEEAAAEEDRGAVQLRLSSEIDECPMSTSNADDP
jgi:solute carrier family 35 protein F5